MNMSKSILITSDQVRHLAKLAHLSIAEKSVGYFQAKLEYLLEYVKVINSIKTSNIDATTQVTGLTNVLREDIVDEARMLTQAQALSNAKKTHNGFFMVSTIFKTI